MKTEIIVLVLGILVILGAVIVIYQTCNDMIHAQDRILWQFMSYIVSSHPSYFDQKYLEAINWQVSIPGISCITNASQLPQAEFEIYNYQDLYYFGHLEADTAHGSCLWDGVMWIGNDTVQEI